MIDECMVQPGFRQTRLAVRSDDCLRGWSSSFHAVRFEGHPRPSALGRTVTLGASDARPPGRTL